MTELTKITTGAMPHNAEPIVIHSDDDATYPGVGSTFSRMGSDRHRM